MPENFDPNQKQIPGDENKINVLKFDLPITDKANNSKALLLLISQISRPEEKNIRTTACRRYFISLTSPGGSDQRPHQTPRQVSPTPQHVCGPPESTKRALARCLIHLLIPTQRNEPVHLLLAQRQETTDHPRGRRIQHQQSLDRLSHQSHRPTCSKER